MVKWWPQVYRGGNYPALCKIIPAAVSVFHGPQVESSFNVIGDIVDPSSCRMNIEAFSVIQTVKYRLRARQTSFLDMVKNFSPDNCQTWKHIWAAAGRYKKQKEMNRKKGRKRQVLYGLKAEKESRAQATMKANEAVEQSRRVHKEAVKRKYWIYHRKTENYVTVLPYGKCLHPCYYIVCTFVCKSIKHVYLGVVDKHFNKIFFPNGKHSRQTVHSVYRICTLVTTQSKFQTQKYFPTFLH